MTFREYFTKFPQEDMEGFCTAYANEEDNYFLILIDGEPDAILSPAGFFQRGNGTLTSGVLEQFARIVNEDYDLYHGRTDTQIALDAMHRKTCRHCPFFNVCDLMDDEIDE